MASQVVMVDTSILIDYFRKKDKSKTRLFSDAAIVAVEIKNKLKKLRKAIDTADLFIASIAVTHNLIFDTLNQKHFENIENLKLLAAI